MKLKKLILKLNKAEMDHKLNKVKEIWFKILKKSFKHKHTHSVR
jgi:hypothetical protein